VQGYEIKFKNGKRSETWHIILSAKAAIKRSVLLFVMTMESITIIAMRAKSKSMRL
tara:strand:- start:2111 stop:2278 length:168 start_codon:yes stop_codon:yes gene_type:complete